MKISSVAVQFEPKHIGLLIPGIGFSYLKVIESLRDNPLFQKNCARAGVSDYRDAESQVFQNHGPALRDNLENQKLAYVVNCTMCDLYKKRGIVPDFVVGYSMGLYSALYAGGYYSFDTGLRIVEKAFDLVRQCCSSRGQRYGMGIILGFTESEIHELLFQGNENGVGIAVYNGNRSFVIAGEKELVNSCLKKAVGLGAIGVRPILTEHPYHSAFLKDISKEFSRFLGTLLYSTPYSKVLSLIDGEIIDKAETADAIVKAIYNPLRLDLVIDRALAAHKVSACYETGPAKSMGKLVRYISKNIGVHPFEEVEDQ
jgi:[acyl-carrier-protein] S-malonyltransferase